MPVDIIKQATLWLATGAEAVGAAVIGLAVLEGAWRVARIFAVGARPGGPAGDQQAQK